MGNIQALTCFGHLPNIKNFMAFTNFQNTTICGLQIWKQYSYIFQPISAKLCEDNGPCLWNTGCYFSWQSAKFYKILLVLWKLTWVQWEDPKIWITCMWKFGTSHFQMFGCSKCSGSYGELWEISYVNAFKMLLLTVTVRFQPNFLVIMIIRGEYMLLKESWPKCGQHQSPVEWLTTCESVSGKAEKWLLFIILAFSQSRLRFSVCWIVQLEFAFVIYVVLNPCPTYEQCL